MTLFHANDLLDHKIIEKGNFAPLYTAGSIYETIFETVQIVRLTLYRRSVKIDFDASNLVKLPQLKFDKRRLQQVVLNLLSNAVKYSNQGIILIGS